MKYIGKFIGKWDGAIKNALTKIKNINLAIKKFNRSAALLISLSNKRSWI